jgi:hypothetical protein
VPPEDIIVQAWRRELGSYVAEPMLRRVAEAAVRDLHDAGWELARCWAPDESGPQAGFAEPDMSRRAS